MKRFFNNNAFIEKKYNQNQIIKLENDECNEIGFVESGSVVIKNYLEDGHENIIKILNTSDIFGLNLIFSNSPFYKGTIEALTNTTIKYITKDTLLDYMKNDFNLTKEILKFISTDFQYLNLLLKIRSQKNAEGKILLALKYFNKSKEKNIIILPFTLKKLSEIIKINRSSMFRSLKLLTKEQIIEKSNKKIIIKDLKKFESLIY